MSTLSTLTPTTAHPMPVGGTVLYVGARFYDRGFDKTLRFRIVGGVQVAETYNSRALGGDIARTSLRTIALTNGRRTVCSQCRQVLEITAPCPSCGLQVGAIWDPSLPVTVMGLPNVAHLSGRQAAQEFFAPDVDSRFTR